MKYLIRAVKYLVYFAIIFLIIVGIIMLTMKGKTGSFNELFEPDSLIQIAIIFGIVSLIYPVLGFTKKKLYLNGDFTKYRGDIVEIMENAGYRLTEEDNAKLVFRHGKTAIRITRMFEDAITFNITDNPVIVEGFRKDTIRLVNAVEYAIRRKEGQENK